MGNGAALTLNDEEGDSRPPMSPPIPRPLSENSHNNSSGYSNTKLSTSSSMSLGKNDKHKSATITRERFSSGSGDSGNRRSLRVLAVRHHSRQENTYIPNDNFILPSKSIPKQSFRDLVSKVASPKKSFHELVSKAAIQRPTLNIEIDSPVEANPIAAAKVVKKKPNLEIKIQDDVDWIQVNEDGSDEEDEDGKKRRHGLRRPVKSKGDGKTEPLLVAQSSCIFTQSGAIIIDGFDEGRISVSGIERVGLPKLNQKRHNTLDSVDEGAQSFNNDAVSYSRLSMNDRILLLCKLGQGASSIVYKALDLGTMNLVAVKMISVYEREKRRQMVRELATLFQLLKHKSPDISPRQDSGNNPSLCVEGLTSDSRPQNLFRKPAHEYIVDFQDAFSAVSEGGVGLVIEYMDGGSLQDVVDDGGLSDEKELASIALQALTGLSYLHSKAHLHRDLKPANFLISKRGEVKVGDFGILREMKDTGGTSVNEKAEGMDELDVLIRQHTLSIAEENEDDLNSVASSCPSPTHPIQKEKSAISSSSAAMCESFYSHKSTASDTAHRMHRASTFIGTACYMAPERIDGKDYSYPSDVWAFGLSLLTVALGRLAIQTDAGYWGLLQSILYDNPPEVPRTDSRFSEHFRDFVSKCLQKNPADRHTCKQLLKHPFLSQAVDEGFDDEHLTQKGINELEEIVKALNVHLQRMKSRHRQEASVEEGSYDAFISFFGDLNKVDIPNAVCKILLGCEIDQESIQTILKNTSEILKIVEEQNQENDSNDQNQLNNKSQSKDSVNVENSVFKNNNKRLSKRCADLRIQNRQEHLRQVSQWFVDEKWQLPLNNLRNLSRQLYISAEEAVIVVLATCHDLSSSGSDSTLAEEKFNNNYVFDDSKTPVAHHDSDLDSKF